MHGTNTIKTVLLLGLLSGLLVVGAAPSAAAMASTSGWRWPW